MRVVGDVRVNARDVWVMAKKREERLVSVFFSDTISEFRRKDLREFISPLFILLFSGK